MTTSDDPDQIRQSIEETRASLSADVDTLNDKVNPVRVAQRTKGRVAGKVTGVKAKVMGTASQGGEHVSGAVGSAQDKAASMASTVSDTAASAPDAMRQRTEGNPLAAGLIAFGAGWLTSSLLPSSQVEQRAGSELKERSSDLAQTVMQEAKDVAQGVAQDLREPTMDAMESVKSTAQDAASEVKSEAQTAREDVTSQAQQSKDSVKGQAGKS